VLFRSSIRFRKPGTGKVSAVFKLSDQQIAEIRQALETQEKVDREFAVEVRDDSGMVIAEIQKVIHVRKKEPR